MISKLERKRFQFSHREARTHSREIARQLEEVIMEELRMLEADEKAAWNRKPSWKAEEAALGNSAAV
eukprot:12896843-Prorocentrum_lima.AAC.1